MGDLDSYLSKIDFSKLKSYRPDEQLDQISKMIVADSEVANDTEPNAMVVGGLGEIGIRRVSPAEIMGILLCHPAVERGIEFKFNRMIKQLDKQNIGNNILPLNNTPKAKGAQEYITEIMNNSDLQPVSWVKQFGRDAMRFGDNYSVLKTNKARSKVLRWELQNPIFFSPMFDITGGDTAKAGKSSDPVFPTDNLVKFRINPTTKKPTEYTQIKKLSPASTFYGAPYGFTSGAYGRGIDKVSGRYIGYGKANTVNFRFVPAGRVLKADRVMQLNFDRIGDEPFGIPIVQTLVQTVSQIIRVEDSGAETLVAFGQNRWKATTPFRSNEKMRAFAKSIENIRKRSVIILPDGVTLEQLKPGSTEFEKVHDLLLTLIAMRLGISIIQLKGTGADINKSCYDEFTQTLTENGWKYYWDIDENERIAQYDKDTGEVEFVKHNGLYVYDHEGPMWHYKNQRINICVTPDHRMLFSPSNYAYDNWQIKKGDEIPKTMIKNGIKFRNTCDGYKGKEEKYHILEEGRERIVMDMDDYLEFVGYYLSEGGMSTYPITIGKEKIYNITFAQNFGYKFDKMDVLFKKMRDKYGLKYTKYKSKKFKAWHWNVHKKIVWVDLYKNYGEYSHTKRIPSWIFGLSPRQLKILYNAMMLGDGHIDKKGIHKDYHSVSPNMIDGFQIISFLIGKSTNLHIRNDDRKKEYKTMYRIGLCDRKETHIHKSQIKEFNYKGKVWCFSVPKTLFVTRRMGKIAIQGNTFGEMQKDIRNDFFADELEIEKSINDGIIKSCKIKYGLKTPDQIRKFPYPKFTFNEMVEDKDVKARTMLQQSLGLRNVAFSTKMLIESGYKKEADRIMKNYLEEVLPDVSTQQQFIQNPPGENK